MAGFGIGLWVAIKAICGISEAVENKHMKDYSYKVDEKGRPTWIDREGNKYVNGEKVVATFDYKNEKLVYAGQKTGTVYIDPEQNTKNRLDGWSEKHKQDAIANDKLAYMRYDHVRKKELTCEISTGKFIAELEGKADGTYWKYYLSPSNDYAHSHCKTEGDLGVQITKEEFDKLNIYGGTHSAYDRNRDKYSYYRHTGGSSW